MKKVLKRILLTLAIILGAILLGVVILFTFLTITEYRPAATEPIRVVNSPEDAPLDKQEITVLSWNVGYCALGEESDFFMDGGKEVRPGSEKIIDKNYAGIVEILQQVDPDFIFLQEVDSGSKRSYFHNEVSELRNALTGASAYALNYKCAYVPYPLPTLGKVRSGLLTFSDYTVTSADRISLPCPFSWPLSIANLKRCLLVTRIPIAGTDRELVLVNLHLEAYDNGEGKIAQTKQLMDFLAEEYGKGNYVIAGGDWNQVFPGTLDTYPITVDLWTPGILDPADLATDWTYQYDDSCGTCRLLNQPYDPADTTHTQYYVIDGFLVSPNLVVTSVETLDLDFANSDHNPVLLTVQLGE